MTASVVVVAAAFTFAATCRFAWTWDGAFLFFRMLQDGVAPVPHGRIANGPLMDTVILASRWTGDVDTLATIHGLVYAVPAVAAMAVGLAMLPRRLAHMRIWVVIGVLFVPLPGQMCPTMEVTPALQLTWVLMVWVWCGRPRRWLIAVAPATVMLFFLHPVAAPLFAVVAAVEWFSSRDRFATSAFAVAALVRAAVTVATIDGYELAQFQPQTIYEELMATLFLGPVAVMVLAVASGAIGGRRELPRYVAAWAAVLLAGLWFFHDTQWFSGSFNYRKFGPIALALAALLATRSVRRARPFFARPAVVVLPSFVFATLLSLGAASWDGALQRLQQRGAAMNRRIVDAAEIDGLRGSPLNHWSGAVTSLLVQGRKPQWVLRAEGSEIRPDGIRLWADETAIWFAADRPRFFDLSHLRKRTN